MTRLKIPRPISGGLILSYKCQARCRHCIYACSPDWKADWITEADLEKGLAQLQHTIQPSAWGPDAIGLSDGLHFTGGEPFLNFPLLLKAAEIAEAHGIPSTFVETNSVWATDDDSTREKLQKLRDAGLKGIMISVNPFYAEYVPFENTERCIRISLETFGQRNTVVYQFEYYRQFLRLGIRGTITIEEYAALAKDDRFLGRVEMFFMGRATTQLKPFYPTYPAQTFFKAPCQPTFLREWHNHFDNYGNYMPGFCGGISLGNWLDLDHLLAEGIDLDDHPVLAYIVANDFEGLFTFAKDRGYTEPEDGYLSKCDLCTGLRRHLVSVGDFAELRPLQFYEHLE
ncbi:MAG: radical SAM protein [Anaerolineae bacterium]|nr:radical SAM protein [Anaerolineae bacterium]